MYEIELVKICISVLEEYMYKHMHDLSINNVWYMQSSDKMMHIYSYIIYQTFQIAIKKYKRKEVWFRACVCGVSRKDWILPGRYLYDTTFATQTHLFEIFWKLAEI